MSGRSTDRMFGHVDVNSVFALVFSISVQLQCKGKCLNFHSTKFILWLELKILHSKHMISS